MGWCDELFNQWRVNLLVVFCCWHSCKRAFILVFIGMGFAMTEEDEAFNEMERQSMWRKRAVETTIKLNPYRDQVIEEVAQAILKMEGFGQDTLHSFAIYIRGLK